MSKNHQRLLYPAERWTRLSATSQGQVHPAVVLIAYAALFLSILGIATGASTSFLTRIATSEAAADRVTTASILASHPAQQVHELDLSRQEFNYTTDNNATLRFQTGIVTLSSYGRSTELRLAKNDYSSPETGFFNVSDGLCFRETSQQVMSLSEGCGD